MLVEVTDAAFMVLCEVGKVNGDVSLSQSERTVVMSAVKPTNGVRGIKWACLS